MTIIITKTHSFLMRQESGGGDDDGGGVGGFFLACKDFGRMFSHSFSACVFFFLSGD